jgi:ATP-dependent exoDNAse (exonuclease V) beta subunit
MILASAGSGKTFALTNRYLSLLAEGARPERIVALTFTRKAAGEFFDEILAKLARAAADPAAAGALAAQMGRPDDGIAPFLRLLRQMVDAMPQLRLGTLDGFFARIVRAFPLELGLTGDFEMLEEHGAMVERRRVLQRMFARTAGGADQAQKDFIEAFKQATFGRDEKRLAARLDAYLDRHHAIFLEAARAEAWGEAERIWPEGGRWGEAEPNPEGALRVLREWCETTDMAPGQRARWVGFAEAVAAWRPGSTLEKAMEYLLPRALEALDDLERGDATLMIERRDQAVTGAAAEALASIALSILAGELTRRLAMTRGIFEVLLRYEEFYHDAVRRGGKLTFADVQRLLEPQQWSSGEAPGGDDSARWTIDYRLDGQIDHWLFDEFQDTSYGQWNILRNLVDEVIQDPSGRRSFFAVGDVKQAIYGWRGGDSRLFREIFNQYNAAASGTIGEEHLDQSRRSGPAVVDLVNQVFGAAGEIAALFPGEASRRWNSEWRHHTSAVPQRDGQAVLLQARDEAGRRELTRDLLLELRPVERGLTCAVLVLSNAEALEVAEYLRSEAKLPAIAESDEKVCVDHPAGAALAALVQAAAHPGDELAWQHVQMSPLAKILAEDSLVTREAVCTRLLTELAADGFARPLERWLRRLEAYLDPQDRFSRERSRQFAAAAQAFDGTGSRDPSEFLDFIARYELRSAEGGTEIRVMTVHKSKGLGFDLVILPALQGNTLNERRDGLAVRKSADRAIEWVLDFPPKPFWPADPVLAAYVEDAEAEACYEKISLLYVALTRAKRGLYLITEPIGRSKSANFPRLLAESLGPEAQPVRVGRLTLTGSWSVGNADWATALQEKPEPAVAVSSLSPVAGLLPVIRRTARRPSAEPSENVPLGPLFSLEAGGAADFGREVHAVLASVEWADPSERAHLAASWIEQGPALHLPRSEMAASEAAAVLTAPGLAVIWEKPQGSFELWRERAFEAILGETWVTGMFDRVVVHRDSAGLPVRAVIYDFKTDRVANEEEVVAALARHEPQLNWYRQAVQALTGLPDAAIAAEIVFTRLRERRSIASAGAPAKF